MYNKNKNYEIVSLGCNCMPRTVLTRGGIKPSKEEGELSCPFDLVRHRFDRVIYYIENDFEDYFDDIFFKIKKRNFLDFRKKGLWQKTDNTKFFHDRDCKYNEKDKLIERISRRIDNFRSILKSNTPILFVLNIQDSPEQIEKLYSLLKKKCGKKEFKIAIFDIGEIIENRQINGDIYIFDLPLPIKNYHDGYNGWNSKKWRESDLGVYFEKLICRFIKKILDRDFSN